MACLQLHLRDPAHACDLLSESKKITRKLSQSCGQRRLVDTYLGQAITNSDQIYGNRVLATLNDKVYP